MEEIWKDVVNYEGLYQISNLGRVRSLDRYVRTISNSVRRIKGVVMTNCFDGNYYHVILHKNGSKKVSLVHRLVACAFVDNPDNLPFVNHIDGNKLNNASTNLEWCTASENTKHAFRVGLCKPITSHYRGVKAFRLDNGSFVGEYRSQHEAARSLGLNVAHVCSVLRGRSKHTCGYYFEYTGKEKCQDRIY